MIPLKEVKVLEINADYFGVPTSQLMENAGRTIANLTNKKFDLKGKNVTIFCGPGNNGGDGFVAARYLSEICRVTIVLLKKSEKIKSELAKTNFKKLPRKVRVIENLKKVDGIIQKSNLIIDAMLGIGITGDLKEPYLSAVKMINSSNKPIISVDVPSGFGTSVMVKPSITITSHDSKDGMNKKNSGEIIVADIGVPKDAKMLVGPGEFEYYPIPFENSHKGDNGRLLIVGGGPYTGAPALAGMAAYRIGIDLVHIATPKKTYPIIAKYSPNFIVHSLSNDILSTKDVPEVLRFEPIVDALVIGPGLGANIETKKAVRKIIERWKKSIVIDANGIEAIAEKISILKGHKGVITPHGGEFQQLAKMKLSKDLDERCEAVRTLSKSTGWVILLKGKIDIISDGERIKLNKTGNVGMTVGGTGDVLTGIVGGLLAKGVEPFNAARLGAFINGYAGDLAFKDKSYALLATDVVEYIPKVLKKFIR